MKYITAILLTVLSLAAADNNPGEVRELRRLRNNHKILEVVDDAVRPVERGISSGELLARLLQEVSMST